MVEGEPTSDVNTEAPASNEAALPPISFEMLLAGASALVASGIIRERQPDWVTHPIVRDIFLAMENARDASCGRRRPQ